jgi:RNA polymerase primary sigma factor
MIDSIRTLRDDVLGKTKTRVLDSDEERMCFEAIHMGRDLVGDQDISKDKEDRILAASLAREVLCLANQGFIASVAAKYHAPSLTMEDLVQHGYLGLLEAINHFDPFQGVRFITYAQHWIRRSISRAVMSMADQVRKPENVFIRIGLIKRMTREGMTDEDIARLLGLETHDVMMINLWGKRTMSIEGVSDRAGNQKGHLPDINTETPHETMMRTSAFNHLKTVFSSLDVRKQEILSMRYGLNGDHPKTYKEIGLVFSVSESRAKQIHDSAITDLRSKIDPDLIRWI